MPDAALLPAYFFPYLFVGFRQVVYEATCDYGRGFSGGVDRIALIVGRCSCIVPKNYKSLVSRLDEKAGLGHVMKYKIINIIILLFTLLSCAVTSHADFAQIHGQYDSYSDFLPSSTFNSKLALLSAAASEDVYLSDGHSASLQNAGFSNFTFVQAASDTQALVGVKRLGDKRIISIVFRGTVPSNSTDVLTDLNAFGTIFRPEHGEDEIMVHTGFRDAMMSFYANENKICIDGMRTLDQVIAERNANDIFWISGHSLGGAIATLYSAMLIERDINPANIVAYTFGAPAVGNADFVKKFDNLINLHRIRNLHDIVPYSTYLAGIYNFYYTFYQIGHQRVYDNGKVIDPATYETPSISDLNVAEHAISMYKSDVGWISNDGISSATTVPPSAVVSDTLVGSDQKNYYVFKVATPGKHVIYTRGDTTTQAALYDANLQPLFSMVRLNGEQNNFRLEASLPVGTYYLEISGLYPAPTGNYRLHIDAPEAGTQTDRDDHGLSAWNASQVAVGSVIPGTLDVPGDIDFFRFTVTTPGKYVIYTRGATTTEAALYDAYYSTLLSVIRLNGERNNFRMEVSLQAGSYYLEVKGLYPTPTGPYDLHIDGPGAGTQTDRDDHGLSAWTATPIAWGSVTPGTLDVAGDEDFFKLNVLVHGNYALYTKGTTTTEAALYDAGYGSLLSSVRLNGESNNFRIEGTFSTGVYYLEIKGLYPTPLGNYSLYASRLSPDQFTLSALTNVSPNTVAVSNAFTVTGVDEAVPIGITGGSYAINGGAYTSSNGIVNKGDTVAVRLTSSTSYSTSKSATLTIGGVSGTFSVTTRSATADTTPAPFSFSAQNNAALTSTITSNPITVNWASAEAPISIVNGSYSINGGVYTSTPGMVNNGSTVTVQLTSSGSYSTTVSAILTIGDVYGTFSVTTHAVKQGDCDADDRVSISEVQSAINMFLGLRAVSACVDFNYDKIVTISEVQRTINSFLGL